MNSMASGTLYVAMEARHTSRSSSALTRAPAWSTTKALTASPRTGSGVPMTAASFTAAWRNSTSSTSRGNTLKPETLIMSFTRSTRK